MRLRFSILLGVWLLASAQCGWSDEAVEQIRSTYAFAPHELNTEQMDAKSKILDELWSRAKSHKSQFVPALRSELTQQDASPFFLYDGSLLLLSLSDGAPDRRLALEAMARCNLQDIQETDYLLQVHRLASLGEDTTDAALHILADPQFKAFIPQHVLTLGQNYSLVFMLLPTDPNFWLARILARLSTEVDPVAQQSLLLVAWYAQTAEADAAIAAFVDDSSKSSESRQYAKVLISRMPGTRAGVIAAGATERALRSARRQTMKHVSDEALIELDRQTGQLALMRK